MQISYTLYPGFLQTKQAGTRKILEGIEVVLEMEPIKLEVKKPIEVEVFQAKNLAKPEVASKLDFLPDPTPIVLATTTPQLGGAKSQTQISEIEPKIDQIPEVVKTEIARVPEVTKTSSGKVPAFIQWGLTGVIVAAAAVALVILTPNLYYSFFPADTVPIEAGTDGSPIGGSFETDETEPTPSPRPLPPQDLSLPTGTWLAIPRIGIRTELNPGQDQETALQEGVWLVPEYGRPGDVTQPMILAAHRYGWQWWWQTDYWKYHSFYNLPTLEPGDIVEVIDDQRKYYYEIYGGEEGEEITDYSADLILYTCKFLSSPLRHFRYARLVDMDKNTQASQSANQAG